jgi:GntR family transcriptional regulator/MocR family aminotransferase
MITINRNSESPIYKQIYDQLKNDILNNTLKSGTRLPATRTLSAEYKISRNSVVAAYEQLSIEGYIKSIVGSGYYVEELNYYNFHNENNFSIPSHNQVSNTVDEPKYNFRYGNLEFNCYQDSNWRKCITSTIDYLSMNESINYLPPEGLLCLRETLSEFLNRTRGVKCIPEQIIVTAGHQAALDIISNLFNSNSYSFAIEEPGYDGCREVFIRNGFTPIAIPIIEDGINIDSAKKLKKSLLYITPSHQFPTGSILPISKRLGLLEYAAKNDNYIIEDDYDSELRYNSMPIPSLQSLDINDRTIYLGTFSKSLSPDLRVAYIVLPFRLIDTYKKIYKVSNSNVPTLLQRALFEYIKSGGYERFINTIRTHYKQKL